MLTCGEGAEKLQSVVRLDKESRKIGSSGGHRSFPKMKGDDKKHEIRFKQIERTLKNKNL
ncbi:MULTISPECIES: hypothetical protein [Bacillus]|uniref:hypothetical protein n=1 Tax=Bacillus TaxID=1386 RepID=UPI00019FF237|nr:MULTISPECIES: hypothetical protein [Bacillus]MDJ0280958.1 hypothetical protein [Bacillus bombysepticus]EEK50782.1 hypothetical protein bcere0002_22820 [Bacillus cereus ATCC 10876]MBG9868811.1 hypothetical protein [Bacillus cereus]MBO1130297.1 hypothetical protein [Bacillus cereus]MCC2506376.1 hypothetical protein [Bacillus cereus]